MRLCDFFTSDVVQRDGQFSTLGHTDNQSSELLVYCGTIHYVHAANKNALVSCVITDTTLAEQVLDEKGLIVVDDPRATFYWLHNELLKSLKGLHKLEPLIGKNCSIHPTAQISDNCRIGNGVTIKENVVIADGVTIENDVFIDVGVVVGSEGILYTTVDGDNKSIRHGGGVIIGEGATLLSNCVVVKSIHPSQLTIIGKHTIIGIASNIGHDVVLGANCVVSGNCVIARGAVIGDSVFIGTSSVIREYIKVGDNGQVKVGSIVVEDISAGETVSGNFAIQHRAHLKQFAKDRR